MYDTIGSLKHRLVWSPCTSQKSVEDFLACLSLPATYWDVRQYWREIGRPYLDALQWPQGLDCNFSDLETLVVAQRNALLTTIDNHLRFGLSFREKTFEEVAVYIFNRACLLAELKVREFGWSDMIKETLCQAYSRQSIASLDIDRAACQHTSSHICLFKLLWGEIASMPVDQIHLRYQSLFDIDDRSSSPIMSSPSASLLYSATIPSGMSSKAQSAKDQYYSDAMIFENPLDDTLIWGRDVITQELDIIMVEQKHNMIETLSVSRTEEPVESQKVDLHSTGNHPCCQEMQHSDVNVADSKAIMIRSLSQDPMIATPLQPKRKELRRRVTDADKPGSRVFHKASHHPILKRKKKDRNAFIYDMTIRLRDTFTRFEKSNASQLTLHARLKEIFTEDEREKSDKETSDQDQKINGNSNNPIRERKRLSRISVNQPSEATLMTRISSIARLLNSISQEVPNSTVVGLSARDIQSITNDSIVRYQHALLDTWHLYRNRWIELIEKEQEQIVNMSNKETDTPIAELICALRTRF